MCSMNMKAKTHEWTLVGFVRHNDFAPSWGRIHNEDVFILSQAEPLDIPIAFVFVPQLRGVKNLLS